MRSPAANVGAISQSDNLRRRGKLSGGVMSDQFKYGDFYLTTAAVIPLLYISLVLASYFVGAFKRPFANLTVSSWRFLAGAANLPGNFTRRLLLRLKFLAGAAAITLLWLAGVMIIISTILSEALSLIALILKSNDTFMRDFVLASTLTLLVILAVPAVISISVAFLSNEVAENYITGGFAQLQRANRDATVRNLRLAQSTHQQELGPESRSLLNKRAHDELKAIADVLREAVIKAAPLAVVSQSGEIGWTVSLNEAKLTLAQPSTADSSP